MEELVDVFVFDFQEWVFVGLLFCAERTNRIYEILWQHIDGLCLSLFFALTLPFVQLRFDFFGLDLNNVDS